MRSQRSPRADPRRALGRLGEEEAAEHLQRLGFTIVERNVRTRHGEIDLIAFDGTTLVFTEVKTRSVARAALGAPGRPARGGLADSSYAWPRMGQRVRLRRLASAWLSDGAQRRAKAETIRFDAIAVTVDRSGTLLRLDHLESAW
jgi:putative endonuclease